MEEIQMSQKDLSKRAKEYLLQIRRIDRLIQTMTQTCSTLRNGLTGRSCALASDKVQSSVHNSMDATIATVMDLENEINARIQSLADLKQQAFRLTDQLPTLDQRNVLIARYFSGSAWAKIAAESHYSERAIYKIHGDALIEFGKILIKT